MLGESNLVRMDPVHHGHGRCEEVDESQQVLNHVCAEQRLTQRMQWRGERDEKHQDDGGEGNDSSRPDAGPTAPQFVRRRA